MLRRYSFTSYTYFACYMFSNHKISCDVEFWNKSQQTFSDSSYGSVRSLRPWVKALPVSHEDWWCHTHFPQVGVAFGGISSGQLGLTVHLMREKAGAPSCEMTRVLCLWERERIWNEIQDRGNQEILVQNTLWPLPHRPPPPFHQTQYILHTVEMQQC